MKLRTKIRTGGGAGLIFMFQEHESQTKKLILKYNAEIDKHCGGDVLKQNNITKSGLKTKNLIKKWNNPEQFSRSSKTVVPGFQGVQSIMQEISNQDTILKRNNGAHGWQAADI